ncbi:hypothetical protein MYX78_00060 [Acidobacteria bacterium AH-259-G07]|nr:hypothetical protein [Acidobacteria bacterium AH-259-G07]
MSNRVRQLTIGTIIKDTEGAFEFILKMLLQHEANVEASQMTRLGGLMSLIATVTVPAKRLETLLRELGTLSDEIVMVEQPISSALEKGLVLDEGCELVVECADHLGIIYAITEQLREKGIRIEDIQSEVVNAPFSGTAMFKMKAKLRPLGVFSFGALERWLGEVAVDRGVNIKVNLIPSPISSAESSREHLCGR